MQTRKLTKKAPVVLLVSLLAIALSFGISFAADKLIIQDAGGTTDVFKVADDGNVTIVGQDANNSFSYKIIGHTGGTSHTQTTTSLANSRLTVMAAEESDFAPRLQMTGPQDTATAVQGWMIFDYGSSNYNLPNSRFVLRHFLPGGDVISMLEAVGRDIITFPNGNVGIGTTNPTHLIHLAGGAYSDGDSWVNASSRELKENIQEVSAEDALQAVENLKPVAFNYKKGNKELHVGFIAEDVPELVATADRKGLGSMDIVAVLTKVVQEQQKTMQELQLKIGELETALQFKQDKDAGLVQK